MLKKWLVFLLVCLACGWPATSFAAPVRVTHTLELTKHIRQAVQDQYKIASSDVLIVWNDQDLETKLAKMGAGLEVELGDHDLKNLIKRSSLLLRVMQGNQYKGRIPVRINVDGWVETYRTVQGLAAGEALNPANIEAKRMRLSELPNRFVQAPFRLEDFQARRAIAAQTVLSAPLLKERPLVERGDPVRVIVINQNLRLVAKGEALETGVRNQTVRVKILTFGSEKIIRAQITDVNEVTFKIDA